MLITRRKQGESLLIGDDIEIVVLEIGQGRVKLGVVAPAAVMVERKEWRLVQDQNRSASGSAQSEFVRGFIAKRETWTRADQAARPRPGAQAPEGQSPGHPGLETTSAEAGALRVRFPRGFGLRSLSPDAATERDAESAPEAPAG